MKFSYKWVVPAVLVLMAIGSYVYYYKKYHVQVRQGDGFENIVAPGVNGDGISLYGIQDKIVLVQFWASWCAPCIQELPDLKNIYARYHSQRFSNANGFDIYMFSLDYDSVRWKTAIERFDLKKMHNVNERAAFKSPTAQRLGVNSIPTNVLIDPNHNVIGVDLDMHELEKTLEKFVK